MVDPTDELLDELLAGEPARDVLRMVTLAPERARRARGDPPAGRGRGRRQRRPLDATAAQTAAAADAGARMVTHLFNAQRALHHREPGLPGLALSDDRFTLGLIADLHHVAAPVVRLVFRAAGGRVALVTDATAAAGMPPGRYDLGGVAASWSSRTTRTEAAGRHDRRIVAAAGRRGPPRRVRSGWTRRPPCSRPLGCRRTSSAATTSAGSRRVPAPTWCGGTTTSSPAGPGSAASRPADRGAQDVDPSVVVDERERRADPVERPPPAVRDDVHEVTAVGLAHLELDPHVRVRAGRPPARQHESALPADEPVHPLRVGHHGAGAKRRPRLLPGARHFREAARAVRVQPSRQRHLQREPLQRHDVDHRVHPLGDSPSGSRRPQRPRRRVLRPQDQQVRTRLEQAVQDRAHRLRPHATAARPRPPGSRGSTIASGPCSRSAPENACAAT